MGEGVQRDIFVAIPSYNHARFIEECIRSIFAQTVHPRKLLVIDDGSKDESLAVIERVLKDSPFETELIARENRGLCNTLNEALSRSAGKYFAYLGSDDYWLPRFLEARYDLLEQRRRAVLAYGHAKLIDDEDHCYATTDDHSNSELQYSDGDPREMLVGGTAPISSTVVYRRSALDDHHWNPTARLEDYEMYLSLVGAGEFAFDPRVLSAWRIHSSNTSRDAKMMMEEAVAAQARHRKDLGLTAAELEKCAAKVRFRWARSMLQFGNKRDAAGVAFRNMSGAASALQLAGFWARMLVPMSAIRLYKGRGINTRSDNTTTQAAAK